MPLTAPLAGPTPVLPPATAPHVIDLGDLRQRLIGHPIYRLVDSPGRVRRFMEHHVFAVWDFQSLLKALQLRLTCCSVPWVPTPDREARRMINEIVLDEESDALDDGTHASHFEMYMAAMRDTGADTGPMERLLERIRAGEPLSSALGTAGVPPAAAEFVRRSFAIIDGGDPLDLVAAFTYGREDVIPEMFRPLIANLAHDDPTRWGRLRHYLERHVEADGETHGPMCRRIVARFCGDDGEKWARASATARAALQARLALWDSIVAEFGPAAG